MNFLNYFGVENFKSFNGSKRLNLKPISIINGTNSSGKSSFTNALKLFISYEGATFTEAIKVLTFEKKNAIFGNFENILNKYSSSQSVYFEFPFNWAGLKEEMTLRLEYVVNPSETFHHDAHLRSLSIYLEDAAYPIVHYKMIFEREEAYDPEVPEREFIADFDLIEIRRIIDENVILYQKVVSEISQFLNDQKEEFPNLFDTLKFVMGEDGPTNHEPSGPEYKNIIKHLKMKLKNILPSNIDFDAVFAWSAKEYYSDTSKKFNQYFPLIKIETRDRFSVEIDSIIGQWGHHINPNNMITSLMKFKPYFPLFEYVFLKEISNPKQLERLIQQIKVLEHNPDLDLFGVRSFLLRDNGNTRLVELFEPKFREAKLAKKLSSVLDFNVDIGDIQQGANVKITDYFFRALQIPFSMIFQNG